MYEYWFLNLRDELNDDSLSHHGTTHDFIQVCSEITQFFGPEVTGNLVGALMKHVEKDIAFIRLAEWDDFQFHIKSADDPRKDQIIRLHKLPR
jgi:hypothetical protein